MMCFSCIIVCSFLIMHQSHNNITKKNNTQTPDTTHTHRSQKNNSQKQGKSKRRTKKKQKKAKKSGNPTTMEKCFSHTQRTTNMSRPARGNGMCGVRLRLTSSSPHWMCVLGAKGEKEEKMTARAQSFIACMWQKTNNSKSSKYMRIHVNIKSF